MRPFREELLAVAPAAREAWVDRRFGLDGHDGLPDDGPALPAGCVPYLPSSVDVILRMIAEADVREADVFVDLGMGIGRTAALVHLLTGATVLGVEVQPALAAAARALAARLELARVSCLEGDAAELTHRVADGTVFYLYCPFGGERLARVLVALERVAARRPIRICCVDLPLPPCVWLVPDGPGDGDLAVYRSRAVVPDLPLTSA
ncbi:MAG: methyltransferase domain-containing protein [Deltaproteobacteria bacterium]|nr:methyltransferase domain-containing protein [Kofleriaceae bacterium]